MQKDWSPVATMPRFLICIPFVALAALLTAQTPTPTAQLPAESTSIKDVPVPIPSQVFATLDKFAHSNWRAVDGQNSAGGNPMGIRRRSHCGSALSLPKALSRLKQRMQPR